MLVKIGEAIVIRTYATQQAADMAVLSLESCGIDACIETDNAGGSCPFLNLGNGVSVLVDKSCENEARAILEKMDTEHASASVTWHAPQKSKNFSVFMLGMLMGLGVASLGWWNVIHAKDDATIPVYDQAGTIHQLYHYQDGDLVKLEEDRNGDGEIDQWSTYHSGESYDVLADDNFDGAVDHWCAYSNSNTGIETFDNNFDGKGDSEIVYDAGTMKKMVEDYDFNGIFDSTCTFTNGVLSLVEVEPNGTNVILRHEKYKDGVLNEEWSDDDMDGTFDTKTLYDPMGRKVEVMRLNGVMTE